MTGSLDLVIERLSTHVLDTSVGRPAAGIPVHLQSVGPGSDLGSGIDLGTGTTDVDGRVTRLNTQPLAAGEYRLTFDVSRYFQETHGSVFYPSISVQVLLPAPGSAADRSHFHLPVLVSTFSYSTYLGS